MAHKIFVYSKSFNKKRFNSVTVINLSEQLDRFPKRLCGWTRKLLEINIQRSVVSYRR